MSYWPADAKGGECIADPFEHLSTVQSKTLSYHGITLDLVENTVSFNGKPINFSSHRFLLLKLLMENKHLIVSKKQIINATGMSEKSIATQVMEIRKEFGEEIGAYIRGIARKGYVLAADEKDIIDPEEKTANNLSVNAIYFREISMEPDSDVPFVLLNGEQIDFPPKHHGQFLTLKLLMENPYQIISRERISKVSGIADIGINNHIIGIRRKLGKKAGGYIRVIKKQGFALAEDMGKVKGENIKKLEEFQHFLDSVDRETLIAELRGMKGYRQVSEESFAKDMATAFEYMRSRSKLLGGTLGSVLQWKRFYGTTDEQDKLLSLIINSYGMPKQEYISMEGLYEIAVDFDWSLDQAFRNVSASLDPKIFRRYKWKRISVSIEVVDQLLGMREEEILKLFSGLKGYVAAAERFTGGDLSKAYSLFSAFLSDFGLFAKLNWFKFEGSIEDLKKVRNILLYSKKLSRHDAETWFLREEFMGMRGYLRASRKLAPKKDMTTTYQNVHAALREIFQDARWSKFRGTPKQFDRLWKLAFGSVESFIEEYEEVLREVNFSLEDFFSGDEKMVVNEVHRLLRVKGLFEGSEDELAGTIYQSLRDFIQKYKGVEMQEWVSKKWFKGDGKMAKENIAAILGDRFSQLEWDLNWVNFDKVDILSREISDSNGKLKQEYLEKYQTMYGMAAASEKHFSGRMEEAFHYFVYLFGHYFVKDKLQWVTFTGTDQQFYDLLDRYKREGLDGFVGFEMQREVADTIFNSHMKQAYRNVVAIRGVLFGDAKLNMLHTLQWLDME